MIENLQTATSDRTPTVGHFEITRRCNFNCPVCYNDVQKRAELSVSQIMHIINEIAEAGCFYLNISGGEPFLHPGFSEIYLHIVKTGIKPSLESNASIITDETIDLLRHYPPMTFNISIYGLDSAIFEGKLRPTLTTSI